MVDFHFFQIKVFFSFIARKNMKQKKIIVAISIYTFIYRFFDSSILFFEILFYKKKNYKKNRNQTTTTFDVDEK